MSAACPLCQATGEDLLWQDERCRVIAAPQPVDREALVQALRRRLSPAA